MDWNMEQYVWIGSIISDQTETCGLFSCRKKIYDVKKIEMRQQSNEYKLLQYNTITKSHNSPRGSGVVWERAIIRVT